MDPAFGPHVGGVYWSATSDANPLYAWDVDFGNGTVGSGPKAETPLVRDVRNAP